MDITNLDPDQKNTTTNDITENKFDRVLIVGNTVVPVGCPLTQRCATVTPDNNIIQDEADKIKIVDPADVNPLVSSDK